jgi:hypothetical protein
MHETESVMIEFAQDIASLVAISSFLITMALWVSAI